MIWVWSKASDGRAPASNHCTFSGARPDATCAALCASTSSERNSAQYTIETTRLGERSMAPKA
jgi:hypothetical protein